MAWMILVAAGLSKTVFAVLLKLSHGRTQPWPAAGFTASAPANSRIVQMVLGGGCRLGPAHGDWRPGRAAP